MASRVVGNRVSTLRLAGRVRVVPPGSTAPDFTILRWSNRVAAPHARTLMSAPDAHSPTAPPPASGCPTPLAWQEVLAAFRSERDEFVLPTSWGEVRLWEFGAGRPLCFLGGAAGDAELFALTAWLLREQYRCLFVALPDPPRDVAVEAYLPGWGDLTVDTLEARDVADVDVLGVGFGGLIAMQSAWSAPRRVRRLVLQGCVPQREWRMRERLLLKVGRALTRPLGSWPLWRGVVESNHRRWFPPFDGSRWEFLQSNLAATPTQRFVDQMRAWERPAVSARLGDIRQPVLIVRSEGEGKAATAGQEELAKRLPHARVEWMHSSGHFPHVTHPHRLVKLIRDFLEAPDAEAAPPAPAEPLRADALAE
jgi:pimeloyl-ACP methyl ester carboxylesterase